MRHTIIFGMLVTIINKKKITRDQLCEKFEISKRTVSRYLDILIDANIPIVSIQGRNGGISIAENFVLSKSFLTSLEMERLVNCVKATSNNFGDNLNYVLLQKLEEAQFRNKNQFNSFQHQTFFIETNGIYNTKFFKEIISTINSAISNSLTLQLQYSTKFDNVVDDLFDPYCVVLKEGTCYVYGLFHKKPEATFIRLSSIKNAKLCKMLFERNSKFDMQLKLLEEFEGEPIELHIEFSNLRINDIIEWLGQESISSNQLKYTAKATVLHNFCLVPKLLSFGSDIKILSPTWLREELISECKRVLSYNTL